MSIERDLEMMDDYLANRLSDADRSSFEQKLQADSALQREFTLQQSFVEGLKKARIAELKNIMNNTPVPPPSGGGTALTLKVASWILAASITGLGIYWFSSREQEPQPADPQTITPVEPAEKMIEVREDSTVAEEQPAQPADEVPVIREQSKKVTKPEAKPKAKQPRLDVYDPTTEVRESEVNEEIDPIIPGERKKSSSLVVETDNTQKKYNFHYHFKEGKLVLMGTFDATLYEILEFITDEKRTIFLYYSGEYYLLDERKEKPTPLNPIKDTELQKKLDKYRAN